jgi:flavin-dependent dehydrogenase
LDLPSSRSNNKSVLILGAGVAGAAAACHLAHAGGNPSKKEKEKGKS